MKYARDINPKVDLIPQRKRENFPEIQSEEFWELYDLCSPFSLLHVTGFFNIYQSANYVAKRGVDGIIVECGCFLGGASIFMWHVMRRRNERRQIYVFDTFSGFSDGEEDVVFGVPIKGKPLPNFMEQVKLNIVEAGADVSDFVMVPGRVEDTLPSFSFRPVSILRLDTDFYSSTKVELEELYPSLSSGGVLIVDDYGMFSGARRATDDYFANMRDAPLLNRVCVGAWAGVKP